MVVNTQLRGNALIHESKRCYLIVSFGDHQRADAVACEGHRETAEISPEQKVNVVRAEAVEERDGMQKELRMLCVSALTTHIKIEARKSKHRHMCEGSVMYTHAIHNLRLHKMNHFGGNCQLMKAYNQASDTS